MDGKTPIIFFGASKFVIPILNRLTKEYDLKLVITTERHIEDAVPSYCMEHNIPYKSVETLKDAAIMEQLRSYNCPVGILAYFGLIVSQEVIALFPKGIVNVHPSLLPRYRGPTPGQTAMLEGNTKTGVSIMLLDKDVDHGPLLSQEEEPILPTDTSETLYDRLFTKGSELLSTSLRSYLAEGVTPLPQDHTKATHTPKLTRNDGFVNSSNETLTTGSRNLDSSDLDLMTKAYFPWPGVFTKVTINGKEKIVKLLPGKKLQVEGKKPMSTKEFLNGYPDAKHFLQKLGYI